MAVNCVVLAAVEKNRALRHYARLANVYERRVSRGLLVHLRHRERAAVLELARLGPGLSLADVGCGTGYYALEAKRREMRVCAIDAVPEMLAHLHGKVDEVRLSDVEAIAEAAWFDRVICAGVLDFVADPELAFSRLCAMVAPGGRLVVLVPRTGLGGLAVPGREALRRAEGQLVQPAVVRLARERARVVRRGGPDSAPQQRRHRGGPEMKGRHTSFTRHVRRTAVRSADRARATAAPR